MVKPLYKILKWIFRICLIALAGSLVLHLIFPSIPLIGLQSLGQMDVNSGKVRGITTLYGIPVKCGEPWESELTDWLGEVDRPSKWLVVGRDIRGISSQFYHQSIFRKMGYLHISEHDQAEMKKLIAQEIFQILQQTGRTRDAYFFVNYLYIKQQRLLDQFVLGEVLEPLPNKDDIYAWIAESREAREL